MADGAHPPEQETERQAARRVLRVARVRATGRWPRAKWWGVAGAVTLLALLSAGLWKPAAAPQRAERAVGEGAGQARGAPRTMAMGAGEPNQDTIEVVAAPAPLQRTERSAERPHARVAAAPGDLSDFDVEAGLLIVDAPAGNPFGLRASDVIVDLCDRPGAESALDMSTALAADASSCLMVVRNNALVRAELGAPASERNPKPEL